MTFRNFTKSLNENGVEGELVKTIFISLFTSIIILSLLYFLTFKNIENFNSRYGFYLLFSAFSYAIITPSIIYVRAYKEFPCMSGMMIGMTIGMISGFLLGLYVGATNGMFYGSVFGMLIGISLGIWNGKCCGVMGVMEGIMAGFMGGLMGAMTAVMMFNENLKAIGIIVFIVSSVIIIGLNFMIFKETRGAERVNKDDEFFAVILNSILIFITIWIIVYGPRSVLFQ